MSASETLISPLALSFRANGFVVLRGCLDDATVDSFSSSIAEDLAAGQHSEVPLGAIGLRDPSTWPHAGALAAHRIVEVVPAPVSDTTDISHHLRALRDTKSTLGCALNSLLGDDAWEIPWNGDDPEGTRKWYVPVTLPEVPPLTLEGISQASGTGVRVTGTILECDSTEEPRYHLSVLGPIHRLPDAAASLTNALKAHTPCSSVEASRLWQPVNRRRVVGKGWHVDVFHQNAVVILLLLSDWVPGGGGTALVPGSHAWVYRQWVKLQGDSRKTSTDGATFDDAAIQRDLNAWVVTRMREMTETGRVRLLRHGPEAQAMLEPPPGAPPPASRNWDACGPSTAAAGAAERICTAVQIVGRAGDVVLMHPLLVHSGTLNLGTTARLLANGLARLRTGPPSRDHLGPMDTAAMP